MSLSYLEKYLPYVNLESLLKTKDEKQAWTTQKLTSKYVETLNKIEKLGHLNFKTDVDNYVQLSGEINSQDQELIHDIAKELIPWRKGPFQVGDLKIDAEWRSDLKWKRIANAIGSFKDQVVLDIGCNNGYYMFQMLKDQPELVLGIDPVVQNMVQFEFINSMAKQDNLKFELLGIEDVKEFRCLFDTIFSMGIIYHHRNPIQQLMDIRDALKSEGTLILETIGIPGEGSTCLFPEDRYSKMRNVWFLPTLDCLKNWLIRTGFIDIEVLSVAETTNEEQRLTPWCPPPFQSLEDFLDEKDPLKTVEGHPAPIRFCIKARKKSSPTLGFDVY